MTAPAVDAPQAPAGTAINAAIEAQRIAVQTGQSAARLAPEGPIPEGVSVPEPDPAVPSPADVSEEALPEPETVPEGPEPIVVALPGRRPGDADMEIEVSDPLVAERIQNALKSYERKVDSSQRYQAAEQMRAEAEEFRAMVQINPAKVVQEQLDPERQAYLALQLLTSDTLWPMLQPHVTGMLTDETGNTRRVIMAELQAESMRLSQQAEQQIHGQRQADRNAKLIARSVDAIIPAALQGAQREAWKQDALAAVANYAAQHNIQSFDPLHLPMVLAPRLRAWNTDPQQAAAHLYATLTGRQAAPAAHTSPGTPPAPTGTQLVRAAATRKAAAAAAPSGAIAPPAQLPAMPKGMKVEDAINFRRSQLGIASQ